MYAGTTFHNKSGQVIGAHQRIDRIARRKLKQLVDTSQFPHVNDILHFEGRNGPDGIKSKSPARDEPWHFIDPTNPDDTQLYGDITAHQTNLIKSLGSDNYERASFEAAWLAHAIVDGLTPAHQYPFEKKIEELWGKPKEARQTIKDKNIIRGENRRDTFNRNWQYWGAKGLWTTHYMFEFGFAASIASVRAKDISISEYYLSRVASQDFLVLYKEMVQQVFELNMYEEYYKNGWTRKLAKQSREQLVPLLVTAVALSWRECLEKTSRL